MVLAPINYAHRLLKEETTRTNSPLPGDSTQKCCMMSGTMSAREGIRFLSPSKKKSTQKLVHRASPESPPPPAQAPLSPEPRDRWPDLEILQELIRLVDMAYVSISPLPLPAHRFYRPHQTRKPFGDPHQIHEPNEATVYHA